jgi:hypothetical protein
MMNTDAGEKSRKTIVWIIVGCLAVCLLLACLAAAVAGGAVLLSQSQATPTPPIDRGSYHVIIRYLPNVEFSGVRRLSDRLEALGYRVELEADSSTRGWSFPQSAFLYGHPSCLDAIADIRLQTRSIADFSGLPFFRFTPTDRAYNQRNIVIQIIENEILRP